MNEIFKLEKKDGITVYFAGGNSNGQFNFYGLTVDNKPEIIFRDCCYFKNTTEQKTEIEIAEYIFNKIKSEADKQLKQYINQHINDTDFYTKKNNNSRDVFLEDRSVLFANGSYKTNNPMINLYYSQITEGKVLLSVNNNEVIFDFKKDDFVLANSIFNYKKDENLTFMDILYGSDLNLILAIEQYKKGTAHKTFTEIVNLNKWLDGKKSVKLIFKDGKSIEIKASGADIKSYYFLIFLKDRFLIDDSWYMKPRLKSDHIAVSELDYLKFGKTTYKINGDNLIL